MRRKAKLLKAMLAASRKTNMLFAVRIKGNIHEEFEIFPCRIAIHLKIMQYERDYNDALERKDGGEMRIVQWACRASMAEIERDFYNCASWGGIPE